MTLLMVAIGAAIGAPMRYLIDRAVQARVFPLGTLVANVSGSFLLGLLATASLHTPSRLFALLGTGLCGALTTYSTFGYETVRLIQQRSDLLAGANVVISIGAGFAAAYAGSFVGLCLF